MSYLEQACNRLISLIQDVPCYEEFNGESVKMVGKNGQSALSIQGKNGTRVTIIIPHQMMKSFIEQVHQIIYDDFFMHPWCTVNSPSRITQTFKDLETKSPNELPYFADLKEQSTLTDSFFDGLANVGENIVISALRFGSVFLDYFKKKVEKHYLARYRRQRCPPERYCQFLFNELGAKDWMQCYHDLYVAYIDKKPLKITIRRDINGIYFVGSSEAPETPFQTICRSLRSIIDLETKKVETHHIIQQIFRNYNSFLYATKRCEECQTLNDPNNLFAGCLKISSEFKECRDLFTRILKIYIENPVNYNSKQISVYDVPVDTISVEEENQKRSFVLDSNRLKEFEQRINIQLGEYNEVRYRDQVGIATIVLLLISVFAGLSGRLNILYDIVFLLLTIAFAVWYIIIGGVDHIAEPIGIIVNKLESCTVGMLKLVGMRGNVEKKVDDIMERRYLQIENLKSIKKILENVKPGNNFICVEIEGNDEKGYKIIGRYP